MSFAQEPQVLVSVWAALSSQGTAQPVKGAFTAGQGCAVQLTDEVAVAVQLQGELTAAARQQAHHPIGNSVRDEAPETLPPHHLHTCWS